MDRDALERRYDGPIPPADPALPAPPPPGVRARLFECLAAEARGQAACRRLRRDLGGADLAADDLACYRAHGQAWRGGGLGGEVMPPSPGEGEGGRRPGPGGSGAIETGPADRTFYVSKMHQ